MLQFSIIDLHLPVLLQLTIWVRGVVVVCWRETGL